MCVSDLPSMFDLKSTASLTQQQKDKQIPQRKTKPLPRDGRRTSSSTPRAGCNPGPVTRRLRSLSHPVHLSCPISHMLSFMASPVPPRPTARPTASSMPSASSHQPPARSAPGHSLPTSANPATHRFSTVVYPSTSVLRTESGSDVLDGLHYGRLGSPAARALEAALARRFAAHGCVLAPSRGAALVAATTAWLRNGDVIAAPGRIRNENKPVLDNLLPRLGVSVLRYSGLGELEGLVRGAKPRVVLLEAPVPPLFAGAVHVDEIPRIRDICGRGVVLVLDNLGDVIPSADVLSSGCVDVVLSSADRCGGLLDGNSSLQFGVLLCGGQRVYRKVRAAVRGRLGPTTAGSPNADDCVKATLAMRSAEARREVQSKAMGKIVAMLQSGSMNPGVKNFITFPGSLDIGIELIDVGAFLDGLRLVRIGDGVGGGNSSSFAWPSWLEDPESNWVVLSVGLEPPDTIVDDLLQAAHLLQK